MSDNFGHGDDEPTLPARPYPPKEKPGQQDKLVLGSFQNQPDSSQRRPYQYPPPQPPAGPPQRYPQPGPGPYYPPPQQPPAGPPQRSPQGAYPPQPPYTPPGQQSYPNAPARPGNDRNSYPQPGQMANIPAPRRRPQRRRGCSIGCLAALALVLVVGVFAFSTVQHVLAFGSTVSTQPALSTETGFMSTSNRVNVLVMGYGGSGHDGAYLTDSMLVMSVLPQSHHTSLVSVPRDLWVQNPANSGNYTKVNAVYEVGSQNNAQPVAGGNAAAAKIALITGMDVKYWLTINFAGFRGFIDSLGGIDVYVPDSFNACYPKNDDANVDASWIKVQFNKGLQHMDGATAIQYARAREPLEVCGKGTSQNLAELTDFGRSARQQIIMKAALSQVKQISTWPKMYAALDALKKTIYTNMSLADLGEFALKMDLNDPKAAHIGLSNQNVLMDSTVGGGYVLLPQGSNWSLIPPYIQSHLYN